MRNKLLIAFLSFLGGFCICASVKPSPSYTVSLSVKDWNVVYEVFEKSYAPYAEVTRVKNIISEQLKSQIDTTKNK